MLPSVKNGADTTTKVQPKREVKKGINIRWNSTIFFQVGLIISMLGMWGIIESDWKLSPTAVMDTGGNLDLFDPPTLVYVVDEPKPVEKVVKKVVQKSTPEPKPSDQIEVVKNDRHRALELAQLRKHHLGGQVLRLFRDPVHGAVEAGLQKDRREVGHLIRHLPEPQRGTGIARPQDRR